MEAHLRRKISAVLLAALFFGWGAALAYADRIKIEALPPHERLDSSYLHKVHTLECATQFPSVDWAVGTMKNFGWRLASREQAALHLHTAARFRTALSEVGRAWSPEAALAQVDGVGALTGYPPIGNRIIFLVDDEVPSMSLKMSLALKDFGDAKEVEQICELLVTNKQFVERFRAELDESTVPALSSPTSGMIHFFRQSNISFSEWELFPELHVEVRLLDWKRMFGEEPNFADAYAMSMSRHSRLGGKLREN